MSHSPFMIFSVLWQAYLGMMMNQRRHTSGTLVLYSHIKQYQLKCLYQVGRGSSTQWLLQLVLSSLNHFAQVLTKICSEKLIRRAVSKFCSESLDNLIQLRLKVDQISSFVSYKQTQAQKQNLKHCSSIYIPFIQYYASSKRVHCKMWENA